MGIWIAIVVVIRFNSFLVELYERNWENITTCSPNRFGEHSNVCKCPSRSRRFIFSLNLSGKCQIANRENINKPSKQLSAHILNITQFTCNLHCSACTIFKIFFNRTSLSLLYNKQKQITFYLISICNSQRISLK